MAIVIVAVLLAISLFIISNTIKLTVYSRRLEIRIIISGRLAGLSSATIRERMRESYV